MEKPAPPQQGRPPGRRYPYTRTVKMREVDMHRLQVLAERLDREQSWVIRHAIEELAKAEGVK